MYEVIQAMSNPCWKEKTVFVLMQDCKPLSSTKIISYIHYWADKCLELEASLKKLPKTSKGAMPKQLRTMKRIRDSIGDFLNDVADSNCPPIYTAIEEICARVGITPKAKFSKKAVKGASDSMKGFLIKSTLRSHGPMTVAEISEDLGITLQAARHYTRQLLDYNEIKAQRNNIATKGIKYSVLN